MSARPLMPLFAALMVLSPAVGAAKTTPVPKQSKSESAQTEARRQHPEYQWDWEDNAAAFRLVRKTDRIIAHPERATQAQLVQAGRDLARAAELEADLEFQPWFQADLGALLYARARAKQGPERTALLETARVHFYLAALTHGIDIKRGENAGFLDYPAASVATSFILYHAGLLQYELGRPSEAEVPLNLLLDGTAGYEKQYQHPEYIEKARTLLATIERAAPSSPKTPPVSRPSKPKATAVKPLDQAAARRLLGRAEAISAHPERATQPQLRGAAHDLSLAAELSPDFQLHPWFHADRVTVLYAQAKAAPGHERRHLLDQSKAQFYLAALTHGLDASGGTTTAPRDVTDYEEAGDATASFILYHLGLLYYEWGSPWAARISLELLLAAAEDHPLDRPEYVDKARTLLPDVKRAEARKEAEEKAHPWPGPGRTRE